MLGLARAGHENLGRILDRREHRGTLVLRRNLWKIRLGKKKKKKSLILSGRCHGGMILEFLLDHSETVKNFS